MRNEKEKREKLALYKPSTKSLIFPQSFVDILFSWHQFENKYLAKTQIITQF